MVEYRVGEKIYCAKCSIAILECERNCSSMSCDYSKDFKEIDHNVSNSKLDLDGCCKLCHYPYSLSYTNKYEVICK